MTELWSVVSAFARTRWLAHRLKSRDDTEAWQQKSLLLWRARLGDIPAFQALANKAVSAWPVMDKRALMADFGGFNRVGITADQGWDILEGRAAPPKGYSVGASTGTSGNRGLYVISESERFEWLGVMLAKTLPRFPLETARIALALPLGSAP
jgi:phenylacetate-coenzyme A ligase PaaK-like adenylate-forming protein